MTHPLPCLALSACMLAGPAHAQAILLDATFDGIANGVLEDFSFLGNDQGVAAGGAWSQSDGVLGMAQDVSSNGTMGMVGNGAFDGTGLAELQVTWVVEAVTDADNGPTNNGFFLGIMGQDVDLWNNSETATAAADKWSIGLRIGGGGNTAAKHALHVSYDTVTANRGVFPTMGTTTAASLQDGFTVTLAMNATGWTATLTGLEDAGAIPITGGSGTWNGDIDFSTITADATIFAASFYQQVNEGGTAVDYASVLVTADTADPDSDNDGLLDAWEQLHFGDLDEVGTGDPDGDGLDNEWEETHGTDPNAPPNPGPLFPFVDTDGDSYRDEAETAFGSNPTDPDECPDHRPGATFPNVVIIYADDMGFGDMSAYGNLFGTSSPAATPSMDSLATDGVMFTQGHSSNGVCTPSRYALLTGKYNWREFDGITGNWGGTIGGDEAPRAADTTIAEFLKTQGYDTAAFGKWHLGGAYFTIGGARVTNNPTDPTTIDWVRPVEHHAVANGFDYFRGLASSINFGPYVELVDDRIQYWDATLNGGAGAFRDATNSDTFHWFTKAELNSTVVGATGSRDSLGDPSYRQVDAGPVMIAHVEEYLANRAAASDPDPFFAYVSLYSPHKPWATTPAFQGADTAQGFFYADWMREVDDRIGRVLAALDAGGYRDNTMVVLTSDNGPENTAMSQSLSFGKDPNGPLRGNKRDVWDGGTRVPFVVRWPGQAAAGLKVSDPVWQGDIFATVAASLHAELTDDVAPDGESFLNLLRGQQKPGPGREAIVVSSMRADLGLRTTDGWKFIDATGGGNGTSWDSSNNSIPNAAGTNRGVPKQLFHQDIDLGEDHNLIDALTDETAIRSELVNQTGTDLLGVLDQLRTTTSTTLYPRSPDNDGDTMPNAWELAYGLDPDWPKDAARDLDGDGATNLDEFIAGTDPTDRSDVLRIDKLSMQADTLSVSWPSVPDRSYELSWSIDSATWTSYSAHAGTGALLSANIALAPIDNLDGIPGNLTRLFVRVGVSR